MAMRQHMLHCAISLFIFLIRQSLAYIVYALVYHHTTDGTRRKRKKKLSVSNRTKYNNIFTSEAPRDILCFSSMHFFG